MLPQGCAELTTSLALKLVLNIHFVVNWCVMWWCVHLTHAGACCNSQRYFAFSSGCFSFFNPSAPSTFIFLHPRYLCQELLSPTQIRLSPGPAKKRSYVQWWQELISNFLHNDCVISSDWGNLAYITKAAGSRRSGWQLSSPEAPLSEIREWGGEKFTMSPHSGCLKLVMSFRGFKINRNKCAAVFESGADKYTIYVCLQLSNDVWF